MRLTNVKKIKGFTLIELMIVVAIIGILAAVAIPKFAELVTKSKEAAVKGNLGAVRSAVSIYYGDMEGSYPPSGGLVTALITGSRYMPTAANGGLGDFTTPPNPKGANPGHAAGKITADGMTAVGTAAADAANIMYDATSGSVIVNCTHIDTKGSTWSTY